MITASFFFSISACILLAINMARHQKSILGRTLPYLARTALSFLAWGVMLWSGVLWSEINGLSIGLSTGLVYLGIVAFMPMLFLTWYPKILLPLLIIVTVIGGGALLWI
jgi:hypothetical protein